MRKLLLFIAISLALFGAEWYGMHTLDSIKGFEITNQMGSVSRHIYKVGHQKDKVHQAFLNNIVEMCNKALQQEAQKLGANAVVGLDYEYAYNFELNYDSIGVLCMGTAVIVQKTDTMMLAPIEVEDLSL